jgi:hypothetical protein
MTLRFKAGDWVRLRNGAVERIESVHPRTMGVHLKDFPHGSHYPTGHFHHELDHVLDIIAIVDEPEALPGPFERFVKIKPYISCMIHESAHDAKFAETNGKIYRCTVTPIELVKP